MSDSVKRLNELTPEQRRLAQMLLEERRKQKGAGRGQTIPRRANPEPIAPLSFGQQRLWFLDRWDSGSPAYNLPQAVRLKGRLAIDVLRRSLNTIVGRHEVLRSRFVTRDGQPMAEIQATLELPLPVIVLEGSGAAREAALAQLMEDEARRPFDLANGPLLRAMLVQLADDEHLLLLTLHHSVSDGWSNGVLVREIGALYQAFSAGQPNPLPELPIQYPDFAAWQRQSLQGAALEGHLDYWRGQLAGAPTTLELPLDYPRPHAQTSNGARHYLNLSSATTERLRQLGQREGASLFMTLLAAFGVLMARYTGQRDLLIGSPIANRNRAEIEPLIGFFVNTLVLRLRLTEQPSFRELIRQVRATALGAQDHQDLPFEKLVEELNLERDMSRNPLFQVMFTLQNTPLPVLRSPELSITPLEIDSGASLVDLSLDFYEQPEGLRGWFEYNTDLFDGATIVRMATHFVTLVESLSANPDGPALTAALLSETEYHQLTAGWNTPGYDFPTDRLVHELFAAQAAQAPQAIAVVYGEQRQSYGELDARANQIDRQLRVLGLGPGAVVGICLERTPELLACVMGVLKSGAAYLPIDPTMPRERLAHVLADTAAALVLTHSSFVELFAAWDGPTLALDSDAALAAQPSQPCPAPANHGGDQPAYIIYTSGSTGRPKGVVVSHASLRNAYYAWQQSYRLGSEIRSQTQMASFSFDVWGGEVMRMLCSGGKLVICPRELLLDAARLHALIEAEQVDSLECVPVVLRTMLRYMAEQNQRFSHLRLLVCGSERWFAHEYQQALAVCPPGARILNSYGLTETTIDNSYFEGSAAELPPEASLPIGRPMPNTQCYILDELLQPVPIGVHGELYIGGAGLALGYLRRPDLTAERFVPNPFTASHHQAWVVQHEAHEEHEEHEGSEDSATQHHTALDNQSASARHTPSSQASSLQPPASGTAPRLYRSGDLARFRPDGNIEIIGRADQQIKVRGFRVEPGEIEVTLRQHPQVQAAAVVGQPTAGGDTRLVAYLVARQEPPPSNAELRSFLLEQLPDYMVPSAFAFLEQLPITLSGKLDRKALPAIEQTSAALTDTYVTPRNTIEDSIAGIWTEILEIDRVGVFDNFFELGGHSLLATYVMSRIQTTFEIDLPLRALFDGPTVAALGERVEQARTARQGLVIPPIEPQPRDQPQPLSLAQERLWLVDQLMPGNVAYISTGSSQINGPLDADALEASFNALMQRHAVLRSNFIEQHGRPLQIIIEPEPLAIERYDLRDLPPDERDRQSLEIALEQARHPFDLGHAPLIRLALVRVADQEYLLHMATHHIIYDLLSMSIFIREIRALYEAFATGRPAPLPELPIQYADFAAWQDRWMRKAIAEAQLPYWQQQLSGATLVLDVPADRRRLPMPSFRGGRLPFGLSLELSKGLKQLSTRAGTTMYMTLLAAFNVLLYRYTGQQDIIVGSPTANRTRAELEGLIGFFVNTLVLRTRLEGNPTFRELLGRVRETALGAYTHQDLPFPRLVEAIQPPRDLSRNPIFQVMFNFLHNYMMPVPELMGIQVDLLRLHGESEQFDLSLDFWERPDGLRGSFDYSRDLFDDATISRMCEQLVTLLTAIVADPDQRIDSLPLLSPAEQQLLQHTWNGPPAPAYDQPVHQLIAAQAARTPNALAVVDQEQRLTYQELNARANQLAHHLRQLGVGAESRVAICVERSLDLIVGLLGIHKAGGAYVPLDPLYPAERLAFMLDDAQITVLLIQAPLLDSLPVQASQTVCLDRDWPQIAQQPQHDPALATDPEQLAYVIYTSGSTGTPKGVMVPQRALTNYTLVACDAYQIGAADRVLQFASVNFDTSAEEIYPCLVSGGTLVLRNDTMLSSSATFLATCRDWQISVLDLPTAYWHELVVALRDEELDWPTSVRMVIIGGERALPERLLDWHASVGSAVTLVNTYGPTETTIVATVADLSAPPSEDLLLREISIGRAIPGAEVYILDRQLQLAPIGVPGELYIGGTGLARCYLHRPDLTAERFVPNPFAAAPTEAWGVQHEAHEGHEGHEDPGNTPAQGHTALSNQAASQHHAASSQASSLTPQAARLYRTGDLARYRADGQIEFVGRNDDQVKIRGFRIELGEIEAVLRSHPAVAAAAVTAREDTPGDRRLVGYVVAREPSPTVSELRTLLSQHLPGYMVPAAFVFLAELPLLPNGKLDRRALPAPDQSRPELAGGFVAPRNATEEVLAGIWGEFLGLEQVGVYDNFFELGGHSLLATQVIAQIRDIYEVDFALQRIFREPTVAGLATLLVELVGDAERLERISQVILELAESDDEDEQ